MEVRIPNPGSTSEQVFRAENAEQMVDVMAKAQSHATKKIRQQAKQLKELQKLLESLMILLVTDKLAQKLLPKLERDES
jgi:hypothetical protein